MRIKKYQEEIICNFFERYGERIINDANKLDEIIKSLHNTQKQEKLLQLYRRLVNQNLQVNLHILEKIKELENETMES